MLVRIDEKLSKEMKSFPAATEAPAAAGSLEMESERTPAAASSAEFEWVNHRGSHTAPSSQCHHSPVPTDREDGAVFVCSSGRSLPKGR